VQVTRLDKKGVGSELVGPIDIANGIRGGQNDHPERSQFGLLANPSQNLKAVDAGHLQVEQHDARKREFGAIAIPAAGLQIKHRLLSVSHYPQWVDDLVLCEGALEQDDVILIVFNKEKHGLIRHNPTYGLGQCPAYGVFTPTERLMAHLALQIREPSNCTRYSVGDWPRIFLNTRLK